MAAPRDLMAPDTEPTDEELEVVMRAAGEAARAAKKRGDEWLAAELQRALAQVAAQPSPAG